MGRETSFIFLENLYTVKAQHRWISSSANQTILMLCIYLSFYLCRDSELHHMDTLIAPSFSVFSLALEIQGKVADLQFQKQGAWTLTALVGQTQKACNNSAHTFMKLLDILWEECLTSDMACVSSPFRNLTEGLLETMAKAIRVHLSGVQCSYFKQAAQWSFTYYDHTMPTLGVF